VPVTLSNRFAESGGNFFAGTYGSGFFLSTDGGVNWSGVNEGYGTVPCATLAVMGPYLFSGGFDGGVYRRSVSQMVTSVQGVEWTTPTKHALEQNYPNPFNPSTTMRFTLPEAEDVTLTVFDVNGREIDRLAEGNLPGGTYQVTWDANGRASGTYYCRLRAGEFVATRVLLLVK
jgi:hypothetical protein